ncbi:choline dehydrogenase (plasmid) [Agrobacterium sp. rho-13.3]|uniref:choline dehydrogenase n=1 Tax=Agrobacterium sp. rho-13.3 TaxID=3072980 RepID=UPI002A0F1E20|nr:choline dehydrogenase [Agrobacterium sp. rho-13.3]MDX8310276.1 choline dehydrogenase [Agrobacterium sp. rho-13.3]
MNRKKYDYIVIGSGAAGSIVAKRLGEERESRILVLEAGPSDNSIFIRMPAALSYPLTDKKRIWSFETGPEPELGPRHLTHVRGKMFGGSGSLNGMVYVRGNPRDYDRWASDYQLPDWSFAHCLPYFKRLETFDGGASEYRGGNGPIAITTMKAELEPFQAFLEAGKQAGHALNDDYNGYRQEGVHAYQANIDHGVRASGGRQYLRPAMRKGNVKVELSALVQKIIFDGKRAVGVRYVQNGETVNVFAEKEVIVCGGAFNSPQILLLSGIGPARELAAVGINTIVDLPGVGKGVQDHIAVSVKYRASRRGVSPGVDMSKLKMAAVGAQWLFLKSGLGATNLWETGSFFKSSDSAEYANIQHEFLPVLGELSHGSVSVEDGFVYQTCLALPRSRGEVTLNSADPVAHPKIVLNYLADRDDQKDLMDGIRHTDEIVNQPAWNKLRGASIDPGLYKMPDAELLAWLRLNANTQYHPCSSCRMGVDDLAVVDTDGRVYGTEGLRVVDASIMPRIVNANLHCPTMMVAEKISDSLRGRPALAPQHVAFA